MQRCLSIIRRNAALVGAWGVLLVGIFATAKELLLRLGQIESDLARVTPSKIGCYMGENYSRRVLLSRLIKYRKLFRYNIWNTRDAAVASRLDTAIVDMETDVSDGTLRKQPYCVVLYGAPGTGKSSFAIQIAKALITSRYGEFISTDFVTLNETDEYQSEYRTYHKVVLFDDIGASSPNKPDTMNPWRKVIDFVNNVKKTALNPNCEMKGKVFITPDLVILTTNLNFDGGQADMKNWIPCFPALQRRMNKIIRVYSYNDGSIVKTKSINQPPSGNSVCLGDTFTYTLDKKQDRAKIISDLLSDFKNHMNDQQVFIDMINSNFDDIPTNLVMESQSGVSEAAFNYATADIVRRNFALDYYRRNINFAHYLLRGGDLLREDSSLKYYLLRGAVQDEESNGAVLIENDLFNRAYIEYMEAMDLLEFSDEETTLNAESKSLSVPEFPESKYFGFTPQFRHNQFICEADTFEYVRHLLQTNIRKGCTVVTNMQMANYGEIDMIISISNFILVIECKSSFKPDNLKKARSQIDKYALVMQVLRPLDRVIGLIYSPLGFQVCTDSRVPVNDQFITFFRGMGYDLALPITESNEDD